MTVRTICCLPGDLVLRQKAKRVPSIDNSIQRLIDDMVETMQRASGVGLAAPQVGVPLRVVVIQIPGEVPFALINPEIVRRTGERVVVEGCLSVPGYVGNIKRAVTVTAKGLDRKGAPIKVRGSDLLAQALEHEIDHLNGILFIDHIENPEDLQRVDPESESEGM